MEFECFQEVIQLRWMSGVDTEGLRHTLPPMYMPRVSLKKILVQLIIIMNKKRKKMIKNTYLMVLDKIIFKKCSIMVVLFQFSTIFYGRTVSQKSW